MKKSNFYLKLIQSQLNVKILSFLFLLFISMFNLYSQNTNVIVGWNYGNGKVMYCGMGYMMHPATYHGDFFQHSAEKQLFVNLVRKVSNVENPVVGIFAVSSIYGYSNMENADSLIAILARNGITGVKVTAAMIDTQAEIDNYDVLILGGSGQFTGESDAGYGGVQSVVKNFVSTNHGGVIFTGWSVYTIYYSSFTDYADMIPVNTSSSYSYSTGYYLVKVLPSDDLYTGIGSVASTGFCEYPAGGVKSGAIVYGTISTYVPSTTPADPTSISVSVNPLCNGSGTQLTANGVDGTVYWYTSSCGGTLLTTGNPITVNPTVTTTYYARNNNSEFSNGCASITVTVYNVLTASISGGTSPICYNTSPGLFTATGSGGTGSYSYLWYKDGVSTGVTTQTYAPGNITGSSSIYCAVTSGSCGTVYTDTTTIDVKLNPSIADAGSDQKLCNVTSAILVGNAPAIGTGNWTLITDPYGDITSISPPKSPTATVYGLKNGRSYTFAWIISNAPCASSSDYITVSVDASSVGGNISGIDTTTYGSATCIMTLSGNTGNVQKWQKKFGTGNWTDISDTNSTYSEIPTAAGTWYYRTVVRNGSCLDADSDSLKITVYKKALSITADNKSKDYDGLVFSPFTVSYNGFITGENSANLTGSLSFSGSAITATDIGTYVIIPSGYTSENYQINYTNGSLQINCADIVNVANNANNGYGSLRNAIANICDNGKITFSNSTNNQSITLTTGSLVIDKNISFDNSNHSNGITITGSGNNLTINTGKSLTLASGSKITVSGGIVNNAGTTGLVIESGASFIHNSVDLQATAKRYLNNGWHLIGSPFKKVMYTVSNISPAGGSLQIKPYTNGTNWQNNVSSMYTYLLPTTGYAVKPSANYTMSLQGNLYYSKTSIENTVNLTYNGSSASQSWNLLANPYTSNIDFKQLTRTNLSPSLYIWDNTMYPSIVPVVNTAYFRTYNALNNVGVPSGTTSIIAPMQGFFVKATYSTPKIVFAPSARTHSNAVFYKSYDTEIMLRLKAETESGADELAICRNEAAKQSFEEYDSEKLQNGNAVEIYSYAKTGEKLTINTANANTEIIPLGINAEKGTKVQISSFGMETTANLYLEDRIKGKLISLSENTAYTFNADEKSEYGRFFIRFGSSSQLNSSDIDVRQIGNELSILAQTGEQIEKVEIYTITGSCVFKTELNSNVFISRMELSAGVYLIRLKTSLDSKNLKINWR